MKIREHPELEKPAKVAKSKKNKKKAAYKTNGANNEEEIKLNVT